jgi:hypothetical protein
MTIFPGGRLSALTPYDVHTSESYISEFEVLSRKLLFNIADADMDDKQFVAWFDAFSDEVRRIRAFWRGAGMTYLSERFSRFTTGDQPSP